MYSVFSYSEYKEAVRAWLKTQPREGRGLLSRMAENAQLSAPMITQILNGDKHLSPEAAFSVASFMGLESEETHYFLLLVQAARAGTHALRASLEEKALAERKKDREIKNKMKPDQQIDELTKQRFYSDWIFSGVRNLVACPNFQTVDAIATHIRMPRPVVQKVVDFLVHQGLCTLKEGRLNTGGQITHVDHTHPLVQQHHKNWRLQAMVKMTEKDDENFFFTAPISLSRADADALRARLPNFIDEVRKVVGPSSSEVVRCLNMDWFSY